MRVLGACAAVSPPPRHSITSHFPFIPVLRIFFKILVMRANFGEFRKFWSISTSKFWKKSCDGCTPILGPISYNFDFRILSRSQSYDKPPWRNFDFLSNFDFGENRKFEIFNPSSNPNFWSLTLNPNLRFWQILDLSSI